MEGWIKLYRDIINHWIFKDSFYFRAWIIILLDVNHEDKMILIEKELIECKRGQSLKSLQSWTKSFGKRWTIQKTRTFFTLLKNDSMINTEGLRKTTRLTVCNYELYQNKQQTNNKQTTSRQQADNKQITTNKNNKENKEYIYGEFYNSEIEKSKGDENYLRIVHLLYGENNLGIKLDVVLKIQYQLTYEQFKKLWYLKEKYKFSFTEIFERIQDWGNPKKRKTVYGVFLTFAKRDNPDIKLQ